MLVSIVFIRNALMH